MLIKSINPYLTHAENPMKRSLRDIAEEYNVALNTLNRRVKGEGKSMLEFNAGKQKLTPAEEKVLVQFIVESAGQGFPLTHQQIKHYANAALMSKISESSS